MHPAYSVIVFTTVSGAGLGLLIWLALLALIGILPPEPAVGFVGLSLALGLIGAGLLASTLHLGRPDRAWRAFSQWRTSWLSREGVAAVATFAPASILLIGWTIFASLQGIFALAALLAIPLALATVVCTGMIYQSLPTIRAWHIPYVTPIYCVFALATGGLLATLLLHLFRIYVPAVTLVVTALIALSALAKLVYWSSIDTAPRTFTAAQATGLTRAGSVRPLDPPHTEPNYVMREMGYAIGRKHAHDLRRVMLAGLAASIALLLFSLTASPGLSLLTVLLAIVVTAVAVFVERWLFFAEAQHVVTLYYGAEKA